MDVRTARDGRAIEEVGTYDPLVPDKDKRCTMKAERIDYWLSVGAQPTEKVKILLDKYKGKVPETRIDAPKPRVEMPIPAAAGRPQRPAPVAAPAPVEAEAPPAEAPAEPQA